jgi:hypothetical protein
MEIEDCAFEFISLLRSAAEHLGDTIQEESKCHDLYSRLRELRAYYEERMDEWPTGSERCKM